MSNTIHRSTLKPFTFMLKLCHSVYIYKHIPQANDKYLEMAIGNAAWPIGVTMVGIHARTGREKISDKNVAHVLNDEIQRKYIQVSDVTRFYFSINSSLSSNNRFDNFIAVVKSPCSIFYIEYQYISLF